jgi:putative membrane protein insertion efficiency factor
MTGAGPRVLSAVVSLPRRAVLGVLRFYQLFVSPMTPPTCRYYPSCSQYAVVAVTRHGVLRGGALAAWRVLRCNPWTRGGVDDVPPARAHVHEHATHAAPEPVPTAAARTAS